MRAIYESKGAAAEYAPLACNLRLTCSHGCTYCYCPAVLRKSREEFFRAGPERPGILEALERDARHMAQKGDRRRVQLCFVGDPYDPADAETQITRQALIILAKYGIPTPVLTKGGLRAVRDFDLLEKYDGHFGVSMAFASEAWREELEPGAAPIADRLKSVRLASEAGIYTWASVEPVTIKSSALAAIIHLAEAGVSEVRVGLDRREPPNDDMWRKFCEDLVWQCNELRLPYLAKESLRRYWPEGVPTDTRPDPCL